MTRAFHGYMRATVFAPKRAAYPAYIQPKHNGIRCLWDGKDAWTREGNLHKPHIKALCERRRKCWLWPKGWTIDGELTLPRHKFSFQQTQSAVTAEGENSNQLSFIVFDAHNTSHWPALPFERRMTCVGFSCATHPVENLEEVEYWYGTFLEQGYEGLIFRTNVPYLFGSGGRNLMKKKPVKHAEFLCIDVWEGTGKDVGTPVYRLLRPDARWPLEGPTAKHTFGVRPKGSYVKRRGLWEQRGSAIGKPYTVEFADYYDSGVPQFPIGIGVRDYE